jgi:hypothetical protein
MQITVQIHPSWQNDNPVGLFKLLHGLNAIARELEAQARAADDRPGRVPDDRGDAWEPTDRHQAEDRHQADDDRPDEDAPHDGRQLLGWSSKQIPDAKGLILSYGKKHGLHSKIVSWTPQQVAAAYRFARRAQESRP